MNGVIVEGRQQRSRVDTIRAVVSTVSPGYFDTAGVALKSGREFTSLEQETSPPVAIVNEKMARDYWPDGLAGNRALGKRIRLPGENEMRQVVGVAGTANYSTWGEAPQPCVYVPMEQNYSDGMTLYVRSKGNPSDVLVAVERELTAAGPRVLVSGVRTGSEIVAGGLFQARVAVAMLGVFGLLALGLASIGLYGILAYSVNQRKREIGLRMALGATRARVRWLILKQGMSLVATGVMLGFVTSLPAGRLLSGMLYGVSAGDPLSVAVAALMLSAVALLACYLPARWASRLDPMVALREA